VVGWYSGWAQQPYRGAGTSLFLPKPERSSAARNMGSCGKFRRGPKGITRLFKKRGSSERGRGRAGRYCRRLASTQTPVGPVLLHVPFHFRAGDMPSGRTYTECWKCLLRAWLGCLLTVYICQTPTHSTIIFHISTPSCPAPQGSHTPSFAHSPPMGRRVSCFFCTQEGAARPRGLSLLFLLS